ncbi:acyl homoserine lactone synthase [Rhizobiales bacterium GAS113]|nr:acyl homoserine lactone synthase [Rhizobiales bacterium GAS113]
MRVFVVSGSARNFDVDLVTNMHRLRRRVFKDRLDWEVSVAGDLEIDTYDALGPTYLIGVTDKNVVAGCARLLPTLGPNMLANTFPALLGDHRPPRSSRIFESSRFCVDTERASEVSANGLRDATFSMLAAVLEWGLAEDQEAVVTVTDVRFERILQRAGWPLERFAPPMRIGATLALAGRLQIRSSALDDVRRIGGLIAPVLVPVQRQDMVA